MPSDGNPHLRMSVMAVALLMAVAMAVKRLHHDYRLEQEQLQEALRSRKLPEDGFVLYRFPKKSGALCLDGSAGGAYVYKPPLYVKGSGEGISHVTQGKWLVHFMGGGWCTDLKECAARSKETLGSSAEWEERGLPCFLRPRAPTLLVLPLSLAHAVSPGRFKRGSFCSGCCTLFASLVHTCVCCLRVRTCLLCGCVCSLGGILVGSDVGSGQCWQSRRQCALTRRQQRTKRARMVL